MNKNETAVLLDQKMLSAAEGVLGSMLIDEKAVGPILQAVTEEDFLKPEYRSVFRAIRDLYGQGKPCDPILLNEYLGGDYGPLLLTLIDLTPTSANAGAYAEILRETSRLWRLREIGLQLNEAVELDACRELVDKANLLLSERSGVRRLDMERGFTEFFKRHSQSRPPDHLRLGLGRLDELVQMRPGDMVVIGGYASAGKTAFALQLAFQIARAKRVGFFSYETDADKLHDRLVACQTQTSYARMMTGKLEYDDYGRVKGLREHLTGPAMELLESYGMTVSGIGAYAMARHYDVIVVDYLQKIPAARTGRALSEFERVSQVSNDLQQLGRRTGKTIIALSQLSRAEHDQKAPTMASLRQSGQIEQDADVVLLLYKEFPKERYSRRCLDVAKNKDGIAGEGMLLNFDGDKQRFSPSLAQPLPKKEQDSPVQQSIFRPERSGGPTPFDEQKGASV